MTHFVSKTTVGETCSMCGDVATHKVGEEIPPDAPCMQCGETWRWARHADGLTEDAVNPRCHGMFHFTGPSAQRHNLTAYVCCRCFTCLLGPATGCPVETKTTVMFEGREWILLRPIRFSDDGKMVGYSVVECSPNGSAKLPAVIHYIEFPTEKLHGDDP